jgi:prepilin-type N-terminal cleavage/methylation domain-containing protein
MQMHAHRVRRLGDTLVSAEQSPRHRSERAMTLLELIVSMAVFAVALGIAVPRGQNGAFALWSANEQLLVDLRKARADALSKGDHFMFLVTSATGYVEYRMKMNAGGAWVAQEPPVLTRTLPKGVIFTAGFTDGTGASFEFNTRGLLVTPGEAASLAIYDAHSELTRQITVWPSGQVAPI